jgi:hypothetical protein
VNFVFCKAGGCSQVFHFPDRPKTGRERARLLMNNVADQGTVMPGQPTAGCPGTVRSGFSPKQKAMCFLHIIIFEYTVITVLIGICPRYILYFG